MYWSQYKHSRESQFLGLRVCYSIAVRVSVHGSGTSDDGCKARAAFTLDYAVETERCSLA